MARESALWARIRGTAIPELLWTKHTVDLQRLENSVGQGHPDVEGCIDGAQIWVELKSEDRPARPATAIKPKTRPSQSIWHKERTKAGSRIHWVLLQVGEGRKARLYLIPGDRYDEIRATEAELELLSVLSPTASPADILLRATRGW
jgi:hypothetical protein